MKAFGWEGLYVGQRQPPRLRPRLLSDENVAELAVLVRSSQKKGPEEEEEGQEEEEDHERPAVILGHSEEDYDADEDRWQRRYYDVQYTDGLSPEEEESVLSRTKYPSQNLNFASPEPADQQNAFCLSSGSGLVKLGFARGSGFVQGSSLEVADDPIAESRGTGGGGGGGRPVRVAAV